MKKFNFSDIWPKILYYLSIVLITVFLTNYLLYANEQNTGTVTIVATVLPVRAIVVDNNLTIHQIVSNTQEDIRPTVFLTALDGREIPYTDAVANQYLLLKPTLDFSAPGVVYQRDERPIQAFFKRVSGFIRKFFKLNG